MEGLGGDASAPSELFEGGFPRMAAVTVGEFIPAIDAEGLPNKVLSAAARVV